MTDIYEKHGFKGEPLDHGELSMPNRTKNIDAQINSFKKDHAAAKTRDWQDRAFLGAERRRNEKAQAKELYKQYGTPMVKRWKSRIEEKGFNAREFIRDESKYNPRNFLALVEQFLREEAES